MPGQRRWAMMDRGRTITPGEAVMRGRGRAEGMAACLLGLGLAVLQAATAAASCPDWRPPEVPTVEEARTSGLCKGTPFEARVEALKRADPEADANAQAARGSFRLMRFGPHDECLPPYPPAFAATCTLTPRTTPTDQEKHYLDTFTLPDIRNDGTEVHCSTVYGALIADYVGRFNRTIIEHPRYPNKDLCRIVAFKDWNTFWNERDRGPRLSEQPKHAEARPAFGSLPAAARFGDVEAVRLLARGARLDEQDDWHVTALEWAVIRGYDEVLELLLSLPADQGQGQEFCAALEHAIAYRRSPMANALVPLCAKQSGASAANHRNRLINHVAGRGDLSLLKAMVAVGFSIDAAPPAGFKETASEIEAAGPYRPLDAFDHLSAAPAAPLHAAAANGHIEIAEFLLKMGARLDRRIGPWQMTPIYAAIGGVDSLKVGYLLRHGAPQPRMVEFLLRHGATLDPGGGLHPESLSTAIHFAVERGNAEVIRLLTKHGVDLNELARNGEPPTFRAISLLVAREKDALGTLLRHGADPDAKSEEPVLGSVTARYYRYSQKALGMVLAPGRTATMHAVAMAPITCGRKWTLLGGVPAKLDPRAPTTDCRHEGLADIELLLAHGAEVGAKDSNGLTALHYAARTDYGLELAELLISRGADVNARDGAGRTPLDHASELGLKRMPPFLIRHGGKASRNLR